MITYEANIKVYVEEGLITIEGMGYSFEYTYLGDNMGIRDNITGELLYSGGLHPLLPKVAEGDMESAALLLLDTADEL